MSDNDDLNPEHAFGGETYDPDLDFSRLTQQRIRVYALMRDGQWRTLDEISTILTEPPASVSARLRDFRKAKYGAHEVQRRRRGIPYRGLHEYRLIVASPT